MGGGIDQQRIAIGLGFRHGCRTEAAAGAAAIFHHNGLAELTRHRVEYDTAENVDGASGRERHDGADRFRSRPGGLSEGGARNSRRR
jgi:hypothetical protein